MDSKTNRNQQEKDFPGYPHYSPEEDITNPGNGIKKVSIDDTGEEIPRDTDKRSDINEDYNKRENARVDPLDEDEDLDIPGAELDDENEKIGEEDEENNYYSLGGDNHEDLEEDREG